MASMFGGSGSVHRALHRALHRRLAPGVCVQTAARIQSVRAATSDSQPDEKYCLELVSHQTRLAALVPGIGSAKSPYLSPAGHTEDRLLLWHF
ncbi:hypothetical protein D9C73_016794 [Collichthys lucidus]|uniref:Uncharacterized protein n=1 Tax=Collichthys lucidus TaxID=240159 RepID=A0A4U5V7T6_COLLU|nr:hypothetical protein D9C73_016794 [Collichthys lucidus]